MRNAMLIFSGFLVWSAAIYAKPLPTRFLDEAIELIVSAGQVGTAGVPEHVQREMRKDAARGRATLQKLLKVNTAMELPAGCTFGYGTLEVGEGLVTKCDELGEGYQFYIVLGDDAVMSVLKACQGGCTGKFVLARPTNPELSKDAHSLGPYGRYLRIWLRPVEIKPAQ